jgi:type VI secretion system protein ImpC
MADAKQTEQQQGVETVEAGDFASLLQKEFKPRTDRAKEEVEKAVSTLAEQVLADQDLITDDAVNSINAIIAEIDRKLTEQLNEIMHHEDFQQLESSWRGLHYLVNNTETDSQLKIKVLNIPKKELGKVLKRYKGTNWDQSPLFKKIYETEYGQLGGEPYGTLIGDYHFNHSPPDVELLSGMAQIAAAAHAPFISAADPSLMAMESWQELSNPRDLTKIFQNAEYAPWRSLRDSDDSRYLALTAPRFLGRMPYGATTNPVEEFEFEEDTDGADSSKYTWVNSAYAMARNVAASFKEYGWCARIRGVESGGLVEGLPTHAFPSDDGGVDTKCPTEIAISDRREKELADNGLMPLIHRKNSDEAVFIGAQTLHNPPEFLGKDGAEATANAALGARLPYIFATSRFAHYLKCIVRDKVGSFMERPQLERFLSDWILNYVDGDPQNSSEDTKARKPLAGAEVELQDIEGKPGYYNAVFRLRPHYQLEGLSVSLRLASKVGGGK